MAARMKKNSTSIKGDTIISPEIKAVGELIGTMRQTLVALSDTFSIIGKQTEKVASLGPAIKASEEVEALTRDIKQQIKEYKEQIDNLRVDLKRRVEEAVRGRLRDNAVAMMKDAVARKVSERVGRLLLTEIPEDLKSQTKGHRRQLLEIKTNVHNTEARRFNSSVRSSKDHLRPLLRPVLHDSPDTATTLVAEPTPSEKFPQTLGQLYSLSVGDARHLLEEYEAANLNKASSPVSPASAATDRTAVNTAELSHGQVINRFMNLIGAQYRILSVPNSATLSPAGKRLAAPLVFRT